MDLGWIGLFLGSSLLEEIGILYGTRSGQIYANEELNKCLIGTDLATSSPVKDSHSGL